MPVIRPFRGLRYNTDVAGNIADNVAPPYDIIYDEWRDKLYERSPYNIIRLIKTRDAEGEGSPDKYMQAKAFIDSWMNDGVLRIDETPSVYVRADTFTVNGVEKTRYGFIALLRIEEFGDNVHPHERTLTAPKIDRLNLVTATKTNLSQIFSVFRDEEEKIQKLLLDAAEKKPEISFVDEQGIHRRLWIVNDPVFISQLREYMHGRDIIIADGHHRYETALNYKKQMEQERTSDEEPFDYVSMYFSSADDIGMTILPTHRKVSGVNAYSQKTFFSELAKTFDIEYFGFNTDLDGILEKIAAVSYTHLRAHET